jgi:kumamolisin
MKKSSSPKRGEIPGSQKSALKGAKLVGAVKPDERIEVTIRVRRRKLSADAKIPTDRPLTQDEFRDLYGADPADIAKVEEYANEHGLDVVQTSVSQRMVRVSGPAAAMKTAFGATLKHYSLGKVKFRGRTGSLSVSPNISDVIEGVFGLDNRPQARPHFRIVNTKTFKPAAASNARPLTPIEVAKLYDFPNFNGSGQCIGIIELGGGFRKKDLTAYFKSLGIAAPSVTAVSVAGGHNSPTGDPNSADGEVMLDIEVAGAVAPKAKIAVYFAPNTDAGFLNAVTSAVHDSVRNPGVISISWGAAESQWTSQAPKDFDAACADAAALGITVCCSAGDHGSSDSDDGSVKRANVDFPASSPNVLACGGTRLETQGSAISSETVWNNRDGWATGGGVSEVFPLPAYQKNVSVPKSINPGGKQGRGVPDISGDADGQTGYRVRVDGQNSVIGGTSAVSPLWAGLIALLNQGLGKPVGFLTSRLYSLPAGTFRDIVSGDNGGYKAGPGWDPCTGLGSPNGKALLAALK